MCFVILIPIRSPQLCLTSLGKMGSWAKAKEGSCHCSSMLNGLIIMNHTLQGSFPTRPHSSPVFDRIFAPRSVARRLIPGSAPDLRGSSNGHSGVAVQKDLFIQSGPLFTPLPIRVSEPSSPELCCLAQQKTI